jgi:Leucine-rich repeat (LRR) protein
MISSIEDLPDELFLDIFSYLSSIDLFLSFSYLNNRFNSILCDQSVQLAIKITNNNSIKINYFSDYFTHIYICNDQINIRQFNNLRSLTLGPSPRPTDELLNQLVDQPLKYFPYLTQLTVYQPLSTWYSPPSIRLWTQLFTNKFSSQLERCSLPGRIFAIPTTCFYCHSLRGLSIGGCSLRDLPALLSALPNLRYLSTDVWGITDIMNISSYQHLNLSHLRIEFNQQTIVLEEIRCLLSYVPYLKIFTIEGIRKHEIFNIEYWYEVLNNQLEYLKKFYCTIRLSDTIENKKLDINYIRKYNSIFSQMKLYHRNDSLYISNQ